MKYCIISLLFVLFLFGFVGYQSLGYDDEIMSIDMVEQIGSFKDLILAVNSCDVHPFGAYVINRALFMMTGSWQFVRLTGALAAGLALWFFWYFVFIKNKEKKHTLDVLIYSFLAVCLNPTVLLWCTGLRWYVYYVPFICLLGILIRQKSMNEYWFWSLYALLATVMLHINYITFIVIAVSFVCILFQRRDVLKKEIITIVMAASSFLLVSSYQIYVFLTVHMKNSGTQTSSFLASFMSGGQNYLCAQGAMPTSIFGACLLVANFVLFIRFCASFKQMLCNTEHQWLLGSYLLVIAAKIGAKTRNFVVLAPELGSFLTDAYALIKSFKLRMFVLILTSLGTIGSVYNVTFHCDTTKASWNTPHREALEQIDSYDVSREALVLTNEPVLFYYLKKTGRPVAYVYEKGWYEKTKEHKGKVIIAKSFKGSMTDDEYKQYESLISENTIISKKFLGYDSFASFKRYFNQFYPDYYLELYLLSL